MTLLIILSFANNRNETLSIDSDNTIMSSKKTAKMEVKSEVTTVTSKKRKRGKESDSDDSDSEDDNAQIRFASAVKQEKSEVKSKVKSEVKSEVIETPTKKRKGGNGGGDEDQKDVTSDHMNELSVHKKKKKRSGQRDTLVLSHAVAKILRRLQH
jgi:hypothetical protein